MSKLKEIPQNIRQAFSIAGYQLRLWHKNPRIIVTGILAFVLCFLLSGKIVSFAETYGLSVQIVEPFVWVFGDADSVLISSVLLLFLFADTPLLNKETPFFLVRTKRSVWLLGQIFYIVIGTFLYLCFLLVSVSFFCARDAFFANFWSPTAAMLGYSGAGNAISIPVTVKTMETTSPYLCLLFIFGLMLVYSLLTVSVQLAVSLSKGHRAGTIVTLGFTVFGFLLKPDVISLWLKLPPEGFYIANVIVGWLSPLNHAVFSGHNFGYDYLPSLAASFLFFGITIFVCFFIAGKQIKRYGFDFSGLHIS